MSEHDDDLCPLSSEVNFRALEISATTYSNLLARPLYIYRKILQICLFATGPVRSTQSGRVPNINYWQPVPYITAHELRIPKYNKYLLTYYLPGTDGIQLQLVAMYTAHVPLYRLRSVIMNYHSVATASSL
jgi:hypothetical protein